MKKTLFNDNWTIMPGVKDAFAAMMGGAEGKPVMLPHDAMISEARDKDCENGNQTGYFPAKSYTYSKNFFAPKEWKNKRILIEFEGVMSKAMVYINEEFVAGSYNGYSNFYVDPSQYLRYGTDNTIKVIAINNNRSSRWYSGSGIYRDVVLWEGSKLSISPDACRITTESAEEYASLRVDTEVCNKDTVNHVFEIITEIHDKEDKLVASGMHRMTLAANSSSSDCMRITVDNPDLWNCDTPYLYTCRSYIKAAGEILEENTQRFGIRTLQLDARKGLRINGESVKLRGSCIHHDNGIIGATTLPKAEEYRIRKLKEAGFNALRSAHHPMGKAMLDLCDELGILVMDELTDMWNVPKNANDDALFFQDTWKDQVKKLVAKDYNHPSVILYSVGNELPEIGRASGRIQCREIAGEIRKADSTRYVTSGFNGFLALSGMDPEDAQAMAAAFAPQETGASGTEAANAEAANTEAANAETSHSEIPSAEEREDAGSEKLNDVMGDIPFEVRDYLNGSDIMTKQLDEVCSQLDVVGLNYMPVRHTLEHRLHPDHVIVGSESYPTEIARLWDIVENHPYVIGDFTWTGYDYLGEAGIGIYHYDVMPESQGIYPDRYAYCGDININGYRRPISYLREIVYGLRKDPFIAVERVNRYGYGCLRNHWKHDDAIDSWTFPGYEGKPAKLKVFSAGDQVELFLNKKSLGLKKAGKECGYETSFELTYEPGELVAVQYQDGLETGRFALQTAKAAASLKIKPSTRELQAHYRDLAFLEISLEDENGVPDLWEKKKVTVSVEGPAELLGIGSADPSSPESFQSDTVQTYDGRILAVIRSTDQEGEATVTCRAEGIPEQNVKIKCYL